MKKSMDSAYTDMLNNLAKSSVAIPLHLQGATGALAWWQSEDSLMAKAEINPEKGDFNAGDHVNLHPATDHFMQGAKHGVVKKVGKEKVHVELYVGGKSTGKVVAVSPKNLLAKSSAENESDEAYEEDEKADLKAHEDKESPAEEKAEKDEASEDEDKDKAEGEKDEDKKEDEDEEKKDEGHDPADIYKSLDAIATQMLNRK